MKKMILLLLSLFFLSGCIDIYVQRKDESNKGKLNGNIKS